MTITTYTVYSPKSEFLTTLKQQLTNVNKPVEQDGATSRVRRMASTEGDQLADTVDANEEKYVHAHTRTK